MVATMVRKDTTWRLYETCADRCILLNLGYKPLGLREIQPGVFDNTEIFNIPKFIPAYVKLTCKTGNDN